MKGDFTRNTFDPANQFTRVLLQQGRVQLDADVHEQTAILLHYLWTLATDLIGPYGAPLENPGFEIAAVPDEVDFSIGTGRYYVAGRLCENNDANLRYSTQPNHPLWEGVDLALDDDDTYFVYLDVWERHVTYLETNSRIREVALGGPDTATRAQLVTQVRVTDNFVRVEGEEVIDEDINDLVDVTDREAVKKYIFDNWDAWVTRHGVLATRSRLKARAGEGKTDTDPCVIPPSSRYRGLENQLYRVEIHRGSDTAGGPTFKFSRDNGSVVFPLARAASGTGSSGEVVLHLEHLGRDDRFGLQKGDWVEIVDDDYTLQGRADPLLQVIAVDALERTVTLSATELTAGLDMDKRPLLRRWDHRGGSASEGGLRVDEWGAEVVEGTNKASWRTLEDGIQVQFQPGGVYQTGDYWLIPARTAIGDIEWPQAADGAGPQAIAPHGATHSYAPLALITFAGDGVTDVIDCRRTFARLADFA